MSKGSYVIRSGNLTEAFLKRIAALNCLGAELGISVYAADEVPVEVDDSKYVHLLKRYWGESAEFRTCRFYDNPTRDKTTRDISQGHIINDIIENCEKALAAEDVYSDIIVTAPTGAGKSVFFQIPGIYLHETRKAVTIVISPLIALMVDQVRELSERGVEFATFINGSISYDERKQRIDAIKAGQYSIVYLAPELLLASDISDIIGERTIGLLVVDEAHLVTSWGRDFRVDYWFLGDYVERLRRGAGHTQRFPVLCLTATAVFGGTDDIIWDLQNSLHLTVYRRELYIGYVRRDDIGFAIRHPQQLGGSDKQTKRECAVKQILRAVDRKKKTIVYFPYKSQVDETRLALSEANRKSVDFVESYTGDMQSLDKNDAYNKFRTNASPVMLATKAFGMGVNIDDIAVVYHYAPTGTLADYVQEIGRAARNNSKVPLGLAITDYLRSDMRYAQTLWGLSGLRHYQLKAMAKKLYELYQEKHSRNLLVSPETFSFLFDDVGLDNKVKSGLMLLSGDLLEHYHFRVINVRAKSMFSRQYIVVPASLQRRFMQLFDRYVTLMEDNFTQVQLAYGKTSAIETYKSGNVYEIDLARMWEQKFADVPFAQFKRNFFTGELFSAIPGLGGGFDAVVPQMKLTITYNKGSHEEIEPKFQALAYAIQEAFMDIKNRFGGRSFSSNDFMKAFRQHFNTEGKVRIEYINMLLDLFSYTHVDVGAAPKEQWKFIEKRKDARGPGQAYCIRTQKYSYIATNLIRYFQQTAPNLPGTDKFIAYVAVPRNDSKLSYQQLMASILQLYNMASYEFEAGKNPQIFVRLNDPLKLERLSDPERSYRNSILTDIEHRHERAKKIMSAFLSSDMSDDGRWEVIESYFLGMDTVVDSALGLNEGKKPKTAFKEFVLEGCDHTPGEWKDVLDMPYAEDMLANGAAPADLAYGTLKIGENDYQLNYAWLKQKVLFTTSLLSEADTEIITREGFRLFDIQEPDWAALK